MTTLELVEALSKLGFTEGFAIRNGQIVVWDNKELIPASLTEFVQLDVNE